MANRLKITLVKSTIGRKPDHIETVNCLGLRKMHSSVEHDDNPSIRGMINKVPYMLNVEEIK